MLPAFSCIHLSHAGPSQYKGSRRGQRLMNVRRTIPFVHFGCVQHVRILSYRLNVLFCLFDIDTKFRSLGFILSALVFLNLGFIFIHIS